MITGIMLARIGKALRIGYNQLSGKVLQHNMGLVLFINKTKIMKDLKTSQNI